MKLCLSCNFQFSDELEMCPKCNTPLIPLGDDPLIGTLIQDRYKIESIIGKGSMGIVYKANQELIGRDVAVKVLHSHLASDQEAMKRFHHQAKAASRLNHPNIITIYDYGLIAGGQPYIVMDLLTGTSLAKKLEESGQISLEETLAILQQVSEALGEAHKNGVVHRDVKPENIVLDDELKPPNNVKVVDFGIAKLIEGSDETLTRITKTGTVCGSPAYMSPEQFQGQDVDHRSDIYSLATVLFELLTGRVPFVAADLVSLMSMHVAQPAPKLKEMRPDKEFPQGLEGFMEKALAKDREDRPANMEEFWTELEKAASTGDSGEPQLETSQPILVDDASAPVSQEEIHQVVVSHLSQKSRKTSQPEDSIPESLKQERPTSYRSYKSRAQISWWIRIVGFVQSIFPFVLTTALLLLLVLIVSKDERISTVIKEDLKPLIMGKKAADGQGDKGEDSIRFQRLDASRKSLETLKRKGKLSAADRETLNKTYIKMATEKARADQLDEAIKLLEKVDKKSRQYDDAYRLIRSYKKGKAR